MQLQTLRVVFGADPEFFFTENGKVIGAEKIFPEDGLFHEDGYGNKYKKPFAIIDGVQAELNPDPNTCRQSFSYGFQNAFKGIHELIKDKGVEVDFGVTHLIEEEELDSLHPKNRELGCTPSLNAYGPAEVGVTGTIYRYRSAGGHIHLGDSGDAATFQALQKEHARTTLILDIVLGNTCVLIDRDEGNKKRRETYGRAGEYRTPSHGLEYRTLSNFWLKNYRLMSLVLSLARFSVEIAANKEVSDMLLSLVDGKEIQKAINNNDSDLARKNFDKVKDFLSSMQLTCRHCDENEKINGLRPCPVNFPLFGTRLQAFELLAKDGWEKHVPELNPMKHWTNPSYMNEGWERWAERIMK